MMFVGGALDAHISNIPALSIRCNCRDAQFTTTTTNCIFQYRVVSVEVDDPAAVATATAIGW